MINPVIGRFTQEDEYRGDGLNLYAYCGNNPVVYYDLTRNWSDSQYNAADYPQLENIDKNIYPATKSEHLYRWLGNNFQNDTYGIPNNLDFEEMF